MLLYSTNYGRTIPNKDNGLDSVIVAYKRPTLLWLLVGLFVFVSSTAFAQVSGVVYRDFNASGTRQTPGEIGVGGVTITIISANGVVTTATSSTVTSNTATLGTYSVTPGGTAPFRVQFSNLPSGYFSGPKGTGSGTTVQYVNSTTATNINLGINYPADYSQAIPNYLVPCYINGDPGGGGTAGTQPVLVSLPYSSTGNSPVETTIGLNNAIGTVYGVAYQRVMQHVYTSAFVKRHAGLGSGGAGAIYISKPSGGSYTNSLFTTLPMAVTVGTNSARGLPAASNTQNNDPTTFDLVGKTGIGDLEISEDGTQLYAMNLSNRALYRIPINNANTATPTPGTSTSYVVPSPTQAAGSVFRPFALKVYRGKVYVGGVTTNETSSTVTSTNFGTGSSTGNLITRDTTAMKAVVYEFDPSTTTFTSVLSFPLTYKKGATANDKTGVDRAEYWLPWISSIPATGQIPGRFARNDLPNCSYPQPMLAGIEFDVDGTMILSIRDRSGDQFGNNNYGTSGTTQYRMIAPGDILKAGRCSPSATQWTIERNATVCGVSSLGGVNNGQGIGGGEFFYSDAISIPDNTNPYHSEMSEGGLALLPGSGDVSSIVLDPTDQIDAGGIRRFNVFNGSGSPATSVQVYASGDASTYGKANGLGDIELSSDPAPIEIGNRVWLDTDGGTNGTGDGLQGTDGNSGIGGLTVLLYENGTTLVGSTTTTAGTGEYYFNSGNVSGGLKPNTTYEIRIALSQTALTGLTTTLLKQGSDNTIDNDASVSGTNAVIAYTTGGYGANDHTLDFGFTCQYITSTTPSATVCSGTPTSLTLSTNATGNIRFVYYTTPQSGTAMYTGGTSLTTATPVSGTLSYSPVFSNTTTTPAIYYIYAVLSTPPSTTACRPYKDYTLTVNPIPTATAVTTGTATCAQSATVSGSSSLTGSSYAWNGPAGFTSNAQSFTTNVAGSYTLVVTANGCSSTAVAATVNSNTAPPAVSMSSATVCAGQTATLTATPGLTTYAFSAGLTQVGGSSGNTATIVGSGTATTTYSVTATNAVGCSATATGSVTVRPVPVATANSTIITCVNAATVTGSSSLTGSTYSWSGPAAFASTAQSFTTNTPGTYTLVVATNGCSSTAVTTTVVQDITPPQNVAASNNGPITCTNVTATVSATSTTSGVTYRWSGPGSFTSAAQSFTTNVAGLYSVTATSSNGCTTITSTSLSQDFATPVVTVNNNLTLTCAQPTGTLTATVTNAVSPTYRWNTGAITPSISVTAGGTYSVTVTSSANGCTAVATTTVNSNTAPPAVSMSSATVCAGQTATLTATPGLTTYVFSAGLTQVGGSSGNTATIVGSGAGTTTYSVTATNAVGCSAVTTGSVTVNPNPAVTLSSATVCAGQTATLTATAGFANYAFSAGLTQVGGSSGNTATIVGSGTATTTYSVTATNAVGCSATATGSVTVRPVPVATANSTIITCVNAATVTGSSSLTGSTYSWSGPAAFASTAQSFTTNTPGTYTLVVATNGCSSTAVTTTVVQDITPPQNVAASNNGPITCSQPTVTVSVTSTTGNVSYRWSGPGSFTTSTRSFTTSTPGLYSVTLTGANGCTTVTSTTVTQPPALTLSASKVNVTCNGTATGSVSLTVVGGTAPFQYNWSNGATTQNITGARAGSYTVTVTDAYNCVSSLTAVVSEPPVLSLTLSKQDIGCNGSTTGTISLTVAGGTTPYSYSWSNGATTQNISNLTAGSYSVRVTDANGCTATAQTVITQPPALTLTTTKQNVRCNGNAEGSIQLTAAGGTPGYTYRWTNNATTQNLSNLLAGTYSVTVTDANGCTATTSATISQPPALTLSTVNQNPNCYGSNSGAIDLTVAGGTAPYSYNWNDGATTEDRTGLRASSYSVRVTDANSCTALISVTLSQPTVLTITGATQAVTCYGGNNGVVSLTVGGGTGPYSYSWSNGATTANISSLTAGNYNVTVTDAQGCQQGYSAAISQPSRLTITGTPVDVACPGQTVTVETISVQGGVPAYQYHWTGPGNYTANTPGLYNVPAGSYTLVVTDANSCTASYVLNIVQPPPFSLSSQVTPVSCFSGINGAIDVTVTGASPPYSYTWTGPTGMSASTEDLIGISSGVYALTVADKNNCTTSISATVVQPTQLTATQTHTNVTCYDGQNGSITLTVAGGTSPYSYSWNDGITTKDRTGLRVGVYSVVITDANGCPKPLSVTITQPPVISLTAQVTNVDCYGGSNGAVSLTATGGTGSLAYRWSTASTTASISSLTAGIYSVTVTDASSCSVSGQYRVGQPDLLQVAFTRQNIGCNGSATGSISTNVTGGTAPYQYTWSDNGMGSSRTGLMAGVYSLMVTDAHGCTQPLSITISQPPALTLTTTKQNVQCYGENNGSISVTTTGGSGAYSFHWNDGTSTESRTGLTAGLYSLTVTDANGCMATTSLTLTQPALVSVTAGNNGPITCLKPSVTVSATSSLTGLAYRWTGPSGIVATTASFSTTTAGIYNLTVTSADGCTATATTTVMSDTAVPNATLTASSLSVCAGELVTLTAGGGASYRWNTGATTPVISVTSTGTYSVTVSAANGCYILASVDITVNPLPVLAVNTTTVCAGETTSLTLTGCEGGTIRWSTGNTTATLQVAPLNTVTYSVTCTYPTSCSSTTTVTVTVSGAPTYVVNPTLTLATCTESNANNDARIDFPVLQNTVRAEIVKGSSYGNGPAFGAGQPVINNAVSFTGLANPTTQSQDYTVRLFGPAGSCTTDIVVTVLPASCPCTVKCVVPALRKISMR